MTKKFLSHFSAYSDEKIGPGGLETLALCKNKLRSAPTPFQSLKNTILPRFRLDCYILEKLRRLRCQKNAAQTKSRPVTTMFHFDSLLSWMPQNKIEGIKAQEEIGTRRVCILFLKSKLAWRRARDWTCFWLSHMAYLSVSNLSNISRLCHVYRFLNWRCLVFETPSLPGFHFALCFKVSVDRNFVETFVISSVWSL